MRYWDVAIPIYNGGGRVGHVGLNYMVSSFCCTTSLHATLRNALIHFLLTYLWNGLLEMLLAISVPYLNLFIGVPFLGLED